MRLEDVDIELIKYRIDNYLGYGNLNSKYWFITLEDHVGKDGINQLNLKFKKKNDILDVVDDMRDVESHMKFYSGEKPRLQNTVSKVIPT